MKLSVVLKLIVVGAASGFAWWFFLSERPMQKRQIKELKVRITSSTEIPEPTNVVSTGDWYYLDHISGSLAGYDLEKKTFTTIYAQSWSSKPDGSHLFKLKPDIKFHDGTPITSKDVIWSIKRHLIFKTSKHFPFADYLVGCENLKKLTDDCPGLYESAPGEITIKLKTPSDSFYLQMASPESGIWAAADMDPETAKLLPTKFSGPYFVESKTPSEAVLKRNENSPVIHEYPNAPQILRLVTMPLAQVETAFNEKKVDLAIQMYSPMTKNHWAENNISIDYTMPSSIIYLFGTGTGERAPIGKDLMTALWSTIPDPRLSSTETFLPFTASYGLDKKQFLAELPDKSAKSLRIMVPAGFFAVEFLDHIAAHAKTNGTVIAFFPVSQTEFFAAFSDPSAKDKYDYVMSIYAASERYPAMQLRMLAKQLVIPPIDLKPAEAPDITEDRATILREFQKWLLRSRQAIPLYFDVTEYLYRSSIDLGFHSKSDAEIELWRVQEKAP